MTRFLADENVVPAHVSAFESAGYDVRRSDDIVGKGASDEAVLAAATRTERILVTYDRKDFASADGHTGVLIVNETMAPRELRTAVDRVVRAYPALDDVTEYLSDWR
jgi:predicted nuclease of predicted toxin-antitoxin system